MPKKREALGLLENQIKYTKELLTLIKEDGRFTALPGIKELQNIEQRPDYKQLQL